MTEGWLLTELPRRNQWAYDWPRTIRDYVRCMRMQWEEKVWYLHVGTHYVEPISRRGVFITVVRGYLNIMVCH